MTSIVQSTASKASDRDLNVVVAHPYSALEIEMQAIFYLRLSLIWKEREKAR